jgi:hypothetical protein
LVECAIFSKWTASLVFFIIPMNWRKRKFEYYQLSLPFLCKEPSVPSSWKIIYQSPHQRIQAVIIEESLPNGSNQPLSIFEYGYLISLPFSVNIVRILDIKKSLENYRKLSPPVSNNVY